MQTLLSDSATPLKVVSEYVATYYDLPIIDIPWDESETLAYMISLPNWKSYYVKSHILGIQRDVVFDGIFMIATVDRFKLRAVCDALLAAEHSIEKCGLPTQVVKMAQSHLSRYFSRMGHVPYWGDSRYSEEGKVVYTLYGPSRDACLKIGEKRKLIKDGKDQYIYGPKVY